MRTPKLLFKSLAIMVLMIVPMLLTSVPASAKNPSSGFKWIYTYTASNNSGVLEVIIYDGGKATVSHYPSICTQQGDHIACDVDIQASINSALAAAGLAETAPPETMYPEIFAQVTGKFSQPDVKGTVVSHPSLLFDLAANGNNVEFLSDWSGVEGNSDSFKYKRNRTYEMTTAFQPGRFDHFVNARPENSEGAAAAELPFQLSGTTFNFYQPKGFTLFKVVVDPGRPGWG